MKYFYFSMLSLLFSVSAFASSPVCDELRAELMHDPNLQVQKFNGAFVCTTPSGNQSCVVQYQTSNSSSDRSAIYSYLDKDSKVYVDGTWEMDAQNMMGKAAVGSYGCTDVYDYFDVHILTDAVSIKISRETARDAMFCPFHKIFFNYHSDCVKE
jgi:hypothetical protein